MIVAPIPLGITMVKKGKPALFLGGGGYAPKSYKIVTNGLIIIITPINGRK